MASLHSLLGELTGVSCLTESAAQNGSHRSNDAGGAGEAKSCLFVDRGPLIYIFTRGPCRMETALTGVRPVVAYNNSKGTILCCQLHRTRRQGVVEHSLNYLKNWYRGMSELRWCSVCLYCTGLKGGGHVVVEVRPLDLLGLVQPPLPPLNSDSQASSLCVHRHNARTPLTMSEIYTFFSKREGGFRDCRC